jgi:hypothetical protein
MKVSSQFRVPATLAPGKTKPGAPEPVLPCHHWANLCSFATFLSVLSYIFSSICDFAIYILSYAVVYMEKT